MSRAGRWFAVAALVTGVATVATWNRGTTEGSAVQPLSGATLFAAKGCATCHVGPDSRPFIDGFPPLDHVAEWAGDRRPGLNAKAYLTESIARPSVFISPAFKGLIGPTRGMPELWLTNAEIDAITSYLLAG